MIELQSQFDGDDYPYDNNRKNRNKCDPESMESAEW